MADAGGLHRDAPTIYAVGDYNRVTFVSSSVTFESTGSNTGAGFIIENATNVNFTLTNGGQMAGSLFNTKEIYPIGIKKVAIGTTGRVYILHK